MGTETAVQVIREAERHKGDRGNFDDLWAQVARRVHPRGDNFQGKNASPGQRRTAWQFDSKPVLGLERFAAVFGAMTMPPSNKYHSFQAANRTIRKRLEVVKWCEALRDDVFQLRYSQKGNFTSQLSECHMSYGAFGTALMMVDDKPGKPINYRSLDLAFTWIAEGPDGKVNYAIREIRYTPEQAIAEFGASQLPQQIITARDKEPNKRFTFYHRIKPREEINHSARFSHESMSWQSDYVCEVEKRHLESGGYRTFPIVAARATTTTNEVYGRSPAITVLSDIKMRNEVWRTVLRSSHRMAEPTMLLSDDAALAPFQMQPGFRNKGYIKHDGTLLAQQLKFEGDLNPAMIVAQSASEDIDDAFLMRVFQMMLENPQMTATEVLERIRERGVLLTPSAGRWFSEFTAAIAMREYDILLARGMVDEMPEMLQRYGGEIEASDNSPIAKAQQAEQAIGFSRTMEQFAPFAEQKPEILDQVNFDKALPAIAEIHGMPSDWLYSEDEVTAIREQRRQQQEMQEMAGAAPDLARAAKDAAQAGVYTQQAGGM